MRIRRSMAGTFLGAALALTAQPMVYELDAGRSRVNFTLGDVLHTVRGTFKVKSGEIRFDPVTGAASGQIVVDATSGNSGSDARDSRMHKNILESQKYPEIVFRPDHFSGKIEPEGTSHIQVHGTFSIHGADRQMTAPVEVHASPGRLETDLDFPVPYVKWGMKNPSTLFLRVKDTVQIEVHAVGTVSAADAHGDK